MSDSPPNVWGLLEEASTWLLAGKGEHALSAFTEQLHAALAQRDRWQLVPKELTNVMSFALFSRRDVPVQKLWEAALVVAPKPKDE